MRSGQDRQRRVSPRWIVFVASGAYLGYAPIVPGTFGTLPGVALLPLFDGLRGLSTVAYLGAFVALVAGAVHVADRAEAIFAEKDSRKITVDEIAGYVAAMLFVTPTIATVATSFVLFRILDVVKPWPASYFDRQRGGRGVVLDDVCAGLYANLALRAIFWAASVPV